MKKTNRVFWGVALIALAVIIVLGQTGLFSITIGIGKIIAAVIAIGLIVNGIADKSYGAIFAGGGILWLLVDDILGFDMISVGTVIVVVILLSIGFEFLFPKNAHKRIKAEDHRWDDYEAGDKVGEHQQVTDTDVNGYITCTNRFGALAKYINSQDFKGGEIENSFGELKVYFDQAIVLNSPIEIRVSSSFGSVQLFVPRNWNVQTDISVFAGDIRDNHPISADTDPVVKISGSVSFGSLMIHYI